MAITMWKFTTTTRLLRHLSTTAAAVSSLPPVDPKVKQLVRSRRHSEVPPYLDGLLSSTAATSDPLLLSSIILSFGFARMADRSLSAFHLSPSTISLNALLTAFSRSGNSDRVPDLFSSLSSPTTPPNSQTYSILISSLSSPDSALAALADMESKGFPPSVVAHTSVIDLLYSSGRAKDAEHLWNQMLDKGCSPDTPAYNVRARNFAERGTPADVLQVFDEMREKGLEPDAVTHTYLISCYCKNGKFVDARRVYKDAKVEGKTNSSTYRSFSNFLCKIGDFETALEVCEDGINKGTFPDAVPARRLVKGLVKLGRRRDAVWLVEKLRENWPPTLAKSLEMLEKHSALGAADCRR